MENEHEQRLALAQRIYDLDAEVYECLGSSLGRVFTGKRQDAVETLTKLMLSRSQSHLLRSELALISNMARTIPTKADRSRIMQKYNDILVDVERLPDSFMAGDILDEARAQLNTANLGQRFSDSDHLIICIGRTYGCAGTDIGFALADALKINYYDTEIFTEVLERLEADQGSVNDRASFAHGQNQNQNLGHDFHAGLTLRQRFKEFSRYHGLPRADAVFFNQSDLICDRAKTENFIVMGRCADVILANNHIPHVSIFITAPFEQRIRRIMFTDNLTYKQAYRLLRKADRRHGHYYNFYTGRKWGNSVNYDLCINSSCYGIDGSVELIGRMIDQHINHRT